MTGPAVRHDPAAEREAAQSLEDGDDRWTYVLLAYALTAGVLWWVAHLSVLSILVPAACEHDITWAIHLTTAVTTVGTAVAVWASLALRHRRTASAAINERTRFLANVSFWFNTISLALILLEGVPPFFVLDACAR